MTKTNIITNIDLTLEEIYKVYTETCIDNLWSSRNDDKFILNNDVREFYKNIEGLLNPSLNRETIRRMFINGFTYMMMPSDKFHMIDDATAGKRDFTISVYSDNEKLILVLTTDEVTW